MKIDGGVKKIWHKILKKCSETKVVVKYKTPIHYHWSHLHDGCSIFERIRYRLIPEGLISLDEWMHAELKTMARRFGIYWKDLERLRLAGVHEDKNIRAAMSSFF